MLLKVKGGDPSVNAKYIREYPLKPPSKELSMWIVTMFILD